MDKTRARTHLSGADEDLFEELDYVKLLHIKLGIDPNELRYGSPSEQPDSIPSRIKKPGNTADR